MQYSIVRVCNVWYVLFAGITYVDRWIEGIGSITDFFEPIRRPSGIFEEYRALICFSDLGTGFMYGSLGLVLFGALILAGNTVPAQLSKLSLPSVRRHQEFENDGSPSTDEGRRFFFTALISCFWESVRCLLTTSRTAPRRCTLVRNSRCLSSCKASKRVSALYALLPTRIPRLRKMALILFLSEVDSLVSA